ncbi:hypothetical protein FI667_g3491, partial [Globisporangium splendens]
MRGFMRAIGLGGLFHRSGSRGSSMRSSSFRPIVNPFEQQNKSTTTRSQHTMAPVVSIEPAALRESRTSSMDQAERPQFLFFCGTESSGRPSSFTSHINLQPQQTLFQTQQKQPAISHRMPVFFAPPSALPTLSPTSISALAGTKGELDDAPDTGAAECQRTHSRKVLVSSHHALRMHLDVSVVRCQTEHRRRRLLHLLDREESKTPRHSLRVVQSLPALPDASVLNTNAPSPKKLASAAFLSPLKSTKRSNDADRRKVQFHDLREAPSNNTEAQAESVSSNTRHQQHPQQRGESVNYLVAPQKESIPSPVVLVKSQRGSHGTYPDFLSLQQQLAKEMAQSKKADELEKQHAKEKAIEVKSFQFEQMRLKQQQKKERKIDEQMLVEQMDWERAQLAIADQDHREYLVWKRSQMRDAYLQTMEVQRRRQTVTAMSKNFFDKLAILPAPQAVEV